MGADVSTGDGFAQVDEELKTASHQSQPLSPHKGFRNDGENK